MFQFRIISEIMNHLDGRTPWTSGQLVARPVPTQDNTIYTDEDKHPCRKRDLNPRSSVQTLKARDSDRAATGSAVSKFNTCM
jgi:hypothetical protein